MTPEQEREAFEAAMVAKGHLPERFRRDDAGEYFHPAIYAAWQAWKARASLAQPASVPAGFALVPVEPTREMLDAVVTSLDDHLLGSAAEQQYRDDWAAMLAASPQAPQPAQADQAAPAPEPEVWLYDFMDGTTAVRNWSTTNKDEAFAPGNFNQRGYVPAEN